MGKWLKIPLKQFGILEVSSIQMLNVFLLQEETRTNGHLQRLARLEFEKLERQVQAEDKRIKEAEKDGLETRYPLFPFTVGIRITNI